MIRGLTRRSRLSYLLLAAALFAFGGLLIASASYEGDVLTCATGVLSFLLGALSVVAAARAWRRSQVRADSPAVWDPSAAPRLGEMLVRTRTISQAELETALQRQKGTTLRLGQILVDMGVLTRAQLTQALEEQLSRRIWQAEDGPRTGTAERAREHLT